MNRLGVWLLLFFLVAGGLFALMVRPGDAPDAPETAERSAPPVAATPGRLPIPVAGVAAAQLADTWNDARGGGARVHNAIDIMAPRGTPVMAATDGTVEKIFESELGGHTVYVRSADGGTVTYYAHLDGYAPGLAEGQRVRAGQAIGRVGSTGSAIESAPHLHFEVHRMRAGEKWYQGEGVNPYPLLTANLAR